MQKNKYYQLLLTKEFLEKQYVELQKSSIDIAKEFGIKSHHTVRQYLQRFSIPAHSNRYKQDNQLLHGRQGNWKGHGKLSGRYWNSIKYHAKYRNQEFAISIKYAWEVFEKQNGKCALSGLTLKFWETNERTTNQTASLDRIDSTKGYVEGNVQWIHKSFQSMKSNKTQSEFIQLCKLVAEHNK